MDKGWSIMFFRNYSKDKEEYFSLLIDSLALYGYYRKEKHNILFPDVNPKNLGVSLISPYFLGNKFIKDYVEKYIYTENPLERFRLSYQIIEMLMDVVVIDNLLHKVIDCQYWILNLRSIQETSTEISRINNIISNAGINETSNFKDACKDLLNLIKPQEKSNDFPDVLYQIRNTIAHRYRVFKDYNTTSLVFKKLRDVCDYFEFFILDILTKYKKNSKINIDKHYKILKEEVKLLTS